MKIFSENFSPKSDGSKTFTTVLKPVKIPTVYNNISKKKTFVRGATERVRKKAMLVKIEFVKTESIKTEVRCTVIA